MSPINHLSTFLSNNLENDFPKHLITYIVGGYPFKNTLFAYFRCTLLCIWIQTTVNDSKLFGEYVQIQLLKLLFYLVCIFVAGVHMYRGTCMEVRGCDEEINYILHICTKAHLQRSEDSRQESILFYPVGPRAHSQAFRLGSSYLYPLSHLTGPKFNFET